MTALNIARTRFNQMDAMHNRASFKSWLTTFIEEKGIQDTEFSIEGESGTNLIPLMVVAEHMMNASGREQIQIKDTLVKVDFFDGDVCHFFKCMAHAIAI
jgi:hypothetical protein